jgi:hypothetical protein
MTLPTRDELAAGLRAQFRSILVDADEWRPLADYVLELHRCQHAELRQAAQRVVDADAAILAGGARADEFGRRLALDALAALLRKETP